MANGVAKVQHYVPQFLLKNFSTGKKKHVHVFDKRTDATFHTNVRNVAAESRFYDFDFRGTTLTIEPGLASLEGITKPIVERILQQDSLRNLPDQDRVTLSAFLAIQFTRTRAFREQWNAIGQLLKTKLREIAPRDDQREATEAFIGPEDTNQSKSHLARTILDAPKMFGPLFFEKTWALLKTEHPRPYLIGDNPLALQNFVETGDLRGNLGLGVKGIEIYFPLSPTWALALWCPSLINTLRTHDTGIRKAGRQSPARETLDGIDSGAPLRAEPANVLNFNSLQIRFAERYVFSSVGDFALARKMVSDSEEIRTGPRPRIF